MSSEVRQSVVDAAAQPETLTIRSLVDWYKDIMAVLDDPLNVEEGDYANQAWMIYVAELATKLEVPVGWLSAAVFELATWEIRLAETAAAEGGAENFAATSD